MSPTDRQFPRDEVENAFAVYFETGPVREDWEAWVELFVDDVFYVDHWWGPLHGKDEVKVWIAASMGGVPEIYTVLDWYTIENETVVFHMQNRRDNPDPDGPPYFDFAGLSVATYAGDGKWVGEEDFWDLSGARRTATAYADGVQEDGRHRPRRPHDAQALARAPELGALRRPTPADLVRGDGPRRHATERAGCAPRTAARRTGTPGSLTG